MTAELVSVTAFPVEVASPVKLALVTTVVALPTEVTPPVRLALVVTVPAVNPDAVPVMFVPTRVDGVPRFGVTRIGLVFITNVVPVPVCNAMEVALPTEVIGPVRFALVTTVVALPEDVTPPVRLALVTTVVALPTDVTMPVRLAFVASFPFSFCMACKILSVAATVPAPDA